MADAPRSEVSQILHALASATGDRADAASRLFAAVYDELRRIAGGAMRRERADHTLQPTALVHEAYLRLVNQADGGWENRAHFFGVAARAMRQILVDHARRHQADKRGGGWQRVTLDEGLEDPSAITVEVIALDQALAKLAAEDERAARVVELRVFAGMTAQEVAHVLGVSKRTVDEDWKVAKMWLSRELAGRELA